MLKGIRRILICSPTGSGKTALTAHMIKTAAEKGMSSWFVVHRRELIKQSVKAFDKAGVFHGIISNGFPEDPRPLVQIAGVQSLARRVHRVKKPRLIVWDECHHVASKSWTNIFNAFPDAFHIGLTATPERLDGKGLGDFFDHMIRGPDVRWLIENSYLSDYKLYAPNSLNMAGVHSRMGDFVRSEVVSAVDKPTITGSAIKEYKSHANGKRAVTFCASIEHSSHVVDQFRAAGISAAHLDGTDDSSYRDRILADFEAGHIKVLSNVDLFGEGFDLPSIECGILLRPTQSLSLYLQQIGRVLRTFPGKEGAIILDHVGNWERHGLPDSERDWSLEGRQAREKKGDGERPVKICEVCFAAQFIGPKACRFCGHEFEKKTREIQEVEGELKEVDIKMIKRDRWSRQVKAESLEDLYQEGKRRGYKNARGWAKHVFNARQRKKINLGGSS